ncbi:PTS sugar transporter subunit IIB [Clostridium sp. AN503]|uniref:PTS system mannose/fructose/N-acetylgalactosamine-transporter subunit IIB n=1 Tax=Clostridium sp. AN503 TaxID=3160598 RepID=UPI003459DD5A
MAIVHARVDERLIHGQVAMVWTNTVGATRIVVVNDAAVKDEMIIAGLKMAKPAGVKLSILSKKRAVEKFAEKAYEGENVFLITKNVGDMAELVAAGMEIPSVNVGNVAQREGSKQIKKSVNLTEQDIVEIKDIIAKGIPVTAQMIPNESDQSILNYLA